MAIIMYLSLGLLAGALSGVLGIGGGILIIPALVYLFGFSQAMAQGTTLAIMVPPIGLLAAYVYYKQGLVNVNAALFVCLGFFIGGFFGAKAVTGLPDELLKRMFGTLLFAIGLKMMIFK